MAVRSLPVLDSLWARLLESVSHKVPPAAFDSWLRPCRLLAVEGDHLRIGAPNPFSRDWLAQHHLDALQHAAQEVVGGHPRVTVVVDEAATTESAPAVTSPRGGGAGTVEGLNPRYTFDTFVVGSSNQFAQAACLAVAELPSRAYNPLFIYGGVGLGKTHLLHAVGHQSAHLFPGMVVAYLSSEHFTNELIDAIRHDRTADFRARYRTIDLLLIDDIQFIAGKERTQEEFFHTFNDLYESRKQIALQRLRPEEYSRNRGALAVALRVGPHRGHPAAGLRDPGGHPQEEGGPRARPSGRRCRLPDGDPSQIQHSPARGLADPDDRLQRDDESRDNRGPRSGGARGPLGRRRDDHPDRAHP